MGSAQVTVSGPRVAHLAVPLLFELCGTASLVAVGLSIVILVFGAGSPVPAWIPDLGSRRLLAGFLFGCTGAAIALSPVGKHSGAHINPIITLAFVLTGAVRASLGAAYVLAQLAGALLGSVPLLAWGDMGRSVQFGATTPGASYGAAWALVGETSTTFALVLGLLFFLRHKRLRLFTPALFPPLYALMVFLEAPVSGTSTNPARTLGPAVIAGEWHGWWVYWLGPLFGALFALAVLHCLPLRQARIEVAKLYHFAHDPHGLWHARRVEH